MRFSCEHGYYKFYPEDVPTVKMLFNTFGIEVVQEGDYYTFPALKALDNFCVAGDIIGAATVEKSVAGDKPDIFAENGLVYNLLLGKVVELATANGVLIPVMAGYFAFKNLPQAGDILATTGQKIVSFAGELDFQLKIVRVESFE
jgi:hypothetical protein